MSVKMKRQITSKGNANLEHLKICDLLGIERILFSHEFVRRLTHHVGANMVLKTIFAHPTHIQCEPISRNSENLVPIRFRSVYGRSQALAENVYRAFVVFF